MSSGWRLRELGALETAAVDGAEESGHRVRSVDVEASVAPALPEALGPGAAAAIAQSEGLLLQRLTHPQLLRSQLAANAALEARASGLVLGARERERHRALLHLSAGDARALLSLQCLLLRGAFPGAVDLAGRGTLLDNLAALAALTGGARRSAIPLELLGTLLLELAVPGRIAAAGQGGVGNLRALLAAAHPAEYVRLVMGLAAAGEVALASGALLERQGAPGPAGSESPEQLLGPALEVLGLADGWESRPAALPSRIPQGAWMSVALAEILGLELEPMVLHPAAAGPERAGVLARLRRVVDAGQGAPVLLCVAPASDADEDGTRLVLVTAIDGPGVDEPWVSYLDPGGRLRRLPLEAFGRLSPEP